LARKHAMDSEFEQVRVQALQLELDARAALAQILLESLENLTEAENERLWLEEAERRQREVREGRVQLVPGDEVKALLDRVLD
jgi:putative addiction module component